MEYINYILFFIIILSANIIQGITGFAGTILAMPFSLMLVGYEVAKPVLNVLGLLSGIYVFIGNKKHVEWQEVKKIVVVMTVGICCGIWIKGGFEGKEQMLYKVLGIFIIILAVSGFWTQIKKKLMDNEENVKKHAPFVTYFFLPLAGIVHGIFVSGGPLLISYLAKRIQEKISFRATISTVWIFLNSIILADDIRNGFWTLELIKIQLLSVPFLLGGMFIGGKLVKRMSQKLFMNITYLLLLISGGSLLFK